MAVLRILSAGAAQAVVERIAPAYASESGNEIRAEFSAVGAMKARVLAGKAVMRMLDKLGIVSAVRPRMQVFPNGYAAMTWLAESRGMLEMGLTQATEILPNPGVIYAGPLPGDLGITTVYSAGLASGAQNREGATDFITRLTSNAARPLLAKAGYEF